jgi:hypothetical protein
MRRKQIKVGREKWEEKMDKDMESSILIPPPHTFLSTLPASFTWYHIFEFTGGGWSDVDLAWIIHAFSSSRPLSREVGMLGWHPIKAFEQITPVPTSRESG